jgi:hypothetical protein
MILFFVVLFATAAGVNTAAMGRVAVPGIPTKAEFGWHTIIIPIGPVVIVSRVLGRLRGVERLRP